MSSSFAVEKTRLFSPSRVRDMAQEDPGSPREGVLLPLIYR